jgi:hypothetical protein
MLIIVISMLLVTTVGCAETYYVKPGATAADFDVDKEDCMKNASMAGSGTYQPSQQNVNAMVSGSGRYQPLQQNANPMVGQNMVDQCLRQRGWRKAAPSETAEIERRQQQQQQ